jgi:hypothetical protein
MSLTTNLVETKPQPTGQTPAAIDIRAMIGLFTAVVLILDSHSWFYRTTSLAVFMAVAFSSKARTSPWLWLGISILWAHRLIFRWYDNEDHIYLAIYWCTSLGLAYAGDDDLKVLAVNARLLIGLTFAFAFFWKVSTPDFRDGALMHYKMLFDYRLRQVVGEDIGRLSAQQTSTNLNRLRSIRALGSDVNEVRLEYPPSFSFVASLMTYWTIAIEGLLAVVFLAPDREMTSRIRNGALMAFSLTTYAIVPVLGFGSLFMTMGLAQCRPNQHRTRLAYMGCQILLLLSLAPTLIAHLH